MKISVAMAFSQHTAAGFIKDAVQLVEAKGVHGIWVPEHVLFFPEYASTYPYSDNGRIPGNPEGILDPFTALTFIAAHTQRVRLGTGICLVPQRQPVYTAKMVADVDYLSGGRVDFGVGIGWLKEEFENLGFNESVIHTDIVSTKDRVATATLVDGREVVIYKDGEFTFEK